MQRYCQIEEAPSKTVKKEKKQKKLLRKEKSSKILAKKSSSLENSQKNLRGNEIDFQKQIHPFAGISTHIPGSKERSWCIFMGNMGNDVEVAILLTATSADKVRFLRALPLKM